MAANVTFYVGTTVPTTSSAGSEGSIYINSSTGAMFYRGASSITNLGAYVGSDKVGLVKSATVTGTEFSGVTAGTAYTSTATVSNIPGAFLGFKCNSVTGYSSPITKGAAWGTTSLGDTPSIQLKGQWTGGGGTALGSGGSFTYYYIAY